ATCHATPASMSKPTLPSRGSIPMLGTDRLLRSISDTDSNDPSVWPVRGKIVGSTGDNLAIRRPGWPTGKTVVGGLACGELSLLGAIRLGHHQRGFSPIWILAHKGEPVPIGRKSNVAVYVCEQLLFGLPQGGRFEESSSVTETSFSEIALLPPNIINKVTVRRESDSDITDFIGRHDLYLAGGRHLS